VPGLNRTSVGLKPPPVAAVVPFDPQGLNRTSVGLKPDLPQQLRHPADGPQSNQRGIETPVGANGIGG